MKLKYALLTLGIVTFSLVADSGVQSDQIKNETSCQHLSMQEQTFASQLANQDNVVLFCSQFTAEQRNMAMEMMASKGTDVSMMSADQVIEKIAKDQKMGMPSTQKSQGGACPAY